MNPFDLHLRRTVSELQEAHRAPVTSPVVADALGYAPRTVRHYLRRLEDMGALWRPDGEKSGYSAMPTLTRIHSKNDDEVLARELNASAVRVRRESVSGRRDRSWFGRSRRVR